MAEVFHTRELAAALADAAADDDKFPLNDLPNDLLVSVFEAVGDLRWVRHTVPLVCKAWAELYRSQNASPLHETLEVNFRKELESAKSEILARRGLGPRRPVVHGSRVISWAERRADWVRTLDLRGGYRGRTEDFSSEDFSSEDLGRLVAVVGSSLTGLRIGCDLDELSSAPFWESLRASVVRHGRLRSLVVVGSFAKVSRSDVEPLRQLAGSLEELVLFAYRRKRDGRGLPRFPESLCALTELRRLVLVGFLRTTAIPAQISSLKKLKELDLSDCCLSSLPKELGELSGLTKLDLYANWDLGNAPQDEALPAELGKMKSLRLLNLRGCRLPAFPAFVGELESLESLNLSYNENLGDAPQDEAFPAALGRRMKSLRDLDLSDCGLSAVPAFVGELESLEILKLSGNVDLGDAPQDEAFPAALGRRMKSLRELDLRYCDLRAVPAFVGELESLETLDLDGNDEQISATLDFLIKGCLRLREVRLHKESGAAPRTPESLAHLEAFKAKLLAKNPNADVKY